MKRSAERIGDYIANAAGTIFTLENQVETIDDIAQAIVKALKKGRTLLTAGNGGSAAEAMHLAEELTGKYNKPASGDALERALEEDQVTAIAHKPFKAVPPETTIAAR